MSHTFDVNLAKLRRRFCDRAIAQSLDLEEIVSRLQCGAPVPQLRADIRRIAHSLAGAGGTFGFAELSANADELDEFARHAPEPLALASACRVLISKIQQAALCWS